MAEYDAVTLRSLRTICPAGEPCQQRFGVLAYSRPHPGCAIFKTTTPRTEDACGTKEARAARDAAQFVPLRAASALGPLIERSQAEPVILFQHDPYCPISRRAYDELAGLSIEAALIDVAQHADIGRLIEDRTGVPHESPQVLVFRSGKVVWSASHFGITRAGVARALRCATASDAVEQPEPNCEATSESRGVALEDRPTTAQPNLMIWLRSMWDRQ